MADVATAPRPLARRRPPRPRRGGHLVPKVQRNVAAWGFLLGAVLCFTFFSWYPIVREVIMSFQKPVYGGGYAWAGWYELQADHARPDVLAGLAEHARVHPARAGHRLRGPVLRGDPAQRAAARPGLPAGARLPAGDAAAGLGAAALRLLLQPAVRPLRRHPAHPAPADLAVGVPAGHRLRQHRDGLGRDRLDLDEHGRRDADLPGRAAEHPRRALRGGRARGRGPVPADQARHDPADQADPDHAADATGRRDHADVRRIVRADQRRRRRGRQHPVGGDAHLPVRVRG